MVLVSVQQLARMATPKAVNALIAALDDRSYRVAAAIALLDRGWGRPPQALEVDWRQKSVREMTDEELMAIIASAQDVAASHALPSPADLDVLDEENQ